MQRSLASKKLSELRAKTDQQLANLTAHRLEKGLAAARELNRQSAHRSASEAAYAIADQAWSEVRVLLPLVPVRERWKFTAAAAELESLLRESPLRASA